MTTPKIEAAARLGQQADPPHMVQPAGCNYTPDEVGRMLGNRVVQPHYAAWLVRKALVNVSLIDVEYARQVRATDAATIDSLLARAERAEAQSEANRRDAERYRWLREGSEDPYVCGVHGKPFGDEGWLTGELLDAAIDAAIGGRDA